MVEQQLEWEQLPLKSIMCRNAMAFTVISLYLFSIRRKDIVQQGLYLWYAAKGSCKELTTGYKMLLQSNPMK